MFRLASTVVLVACANDVAAVASVMVWVHCAILELNSEAPRAIHAVARAWDVAITMTWLRHAMFVSQAWYMVFVLSLALGYVEARGHGLRGTHAFAIRRDVLGAATDTALAALLDRDGVRGCSALAMALIPIHTHAVYHCAIGTWFVAQIMPFRALEIAALCTWNRTRRATRVGPLFA